MDEAPLDRSAVTEAARALRPYVRETPTLTLPASDLGLPAAGVVAAAVDLGPAPA